MTRRRGEGSGSLSLDGHPIPLSAPDLVGPWSVVNWSAGIPSHRHRLVFHHAHLEVDLKGRIPVDTGVGKRLLRLVGEEWVSESLGLYVLVSSVLSAVSRSGLRFVESWSLVPGGLLPVPEGGIPPGGEAVGHALKELRKVDPEALQQATGFHARLGGAPGFVADITLYRVHRARRHALTLDLWGTIPRANLESMLTDLRASLPVSQAKLTRYSPA